MLLELYWLFFFYVKKKKEAHSVLGQIHFFKLIGLHPFYSGNDHLIMAEQY